MRQYLYSDTSKSYLSWVWRTWRYPLSLTLTHTHTCIYLEVLFAILCRHTHELAERQDASCAHLRVAQRARGIAAHIANQRPKHPHQPYRRYIYILAHTHTNTHTHTHTHLAATASLARTSHARLPRGCLYTGSKLGNVSVVKRHAQACTPSAVTCYRCIRYSRHVSD